MSNPRDDRWWEYLELQTECPECGNLETDCTCDQPTNERETPMTKAQLIDAIWKLINQPSEDISDGEVLDALCNLLNEEGSKA